MSRMLAELLSRTEPAFRLQLQRLEQAAGLPAADIRLMTHVVAETRQKIRELNLDPHDTTGPELYSALKTRLNEDERRLRESLGLTGKGPVELLEAVKHQLEQLDVPLEAFVIKPSVMRQLLKKLQPKATMKKLGYRSMDSMLKHEPLPQLLAATILSESRDWQRRRLEVCRQLGSGDFELRTISFHMPTAKLWPKLAEAYTERERQTVMTVAELGGIVLLPTSHDLPALGITTMLLAMSGVNTIRSQSTYLKLQQVRPDFGEAVYGALLQEPLTEATLGGDRLPWSMVQWFYGHGHSAYHPDIFEPHVQPADLTWHEAEDALARLHPALEFWQGSQLLGMLDDSGRPVSLNMLDLAISVCNDLDYAHRLVGFMQAALSRELLARYLHQDNLHTLMLGQLEPALAPVDTDFN